MIEGSNGDLVGADEARIRSVNYGNTSRRFASADIGGIFFEMAISQFVANLAVGGIARGLRINKGGCC